MAPVLVENGKKVEVYDLSHKVGKGSKMNIHHDHKVSKKL